MNGQQNELRDEKGVWRLSISDRMFQKLLASNIGKWRAYANTDGFKGSCYEMTGDYVYHYGEIQLMFWKGDKIIPMKEK
jgi:hypothetical protein